MPGQICLLASLISKLDAEAVGEALEVSGSRLKRLKMSCGEHVERDEELGADLGDVVQSLIAQAGNNARLLECCYWTQEPGLLEMIRAFLAMPVEAQTVLRAFFAAAVVPRSITTSLDATGALTLRSPEAAAVLATLFSNKSGSA